MKRLIVALIIASLLSACVPLLVAGGAAAGLWIGSDPRKPEVIKNDFEAGSQLSASIMDIYKDHAHVNVNVFNNVVLLTGEVLDESMKQHIEQQARQSKYKPRGVYNEMVVASPSDIASRADDGQISIKVKSAILAEASDAAASHIMVVTERGVVYLMGMSRQEIIDKAAHAASRVYGVRQVVKMVEIAPPSPN